MELMELLLTRRTYRRFDQSRPVPQPVIDRMLQAARIASSACNLQPLRYMVVKSSEKTEQVFPLTHWAALLPKEAGQPREGEHPTLFILVLHEGSKTKWLNIDVGLAVSNMTLAAWDQGVGSCIMDNIDRNEIKQICNIPEQTEILCAIAFGYPSHESKIVPVQQDGNTRYYLDENGNYCVPKRELHETVTYI